MGTMISVIDLMSKCDYLEECGSLRTVTFAEQNIEDNTIMLELNGECYKNIHLYDKLVVEDGLVILNGMILEAIKLTKVKL